MWPCQHQVSGRAHALVPYMLCRMLVESHATLSMQQEQTSSTLVP